MQKSFLLRPLHVPTIISRLLISKYVPIFSIIENYYLRFDLGLLSRIHFWFSLMYNLSHPSFRGKTTKVFDYHHICLYIYEYIHIWTCSSLMRNNLFVAKFTLSSQAVLSLNSSLFQKLFQSLTRFLVFFVCLFLSLLMNDDGGWFVVSFVWYKCLLKGFSMGKLHWMNFTLMCLQSNCPGSKYTAIKFSKDIKNVFYLITKYF